MPNDAKIVSLQNQIRKSQTAERIFGAGFLFGLGTTSLGFFLFYDPPPSLSPGFFLPWGLAGLVVMLIFLLLYSVALKMRTGKVKQLEKLGNTIPTCSKCKREILYANSGGCPFCGETPKPEGS